MDNKVCKLEKGSEGRPRACPKEIKVSGIDAAIARLQTNVQSVVADLAMCRLQMSEAAAVLDQAATELVELGHEDKAWPASMMARRLRGEEIPDAWLKPATRDEGVKS